jgi:hypothetical protein
MNAALLCPSCEKMVLHIVQLVLTIPVTQSEDPGRLLYLTDGQDLVRGAAGW